MVVCSLNILRNTTVENKSHNIEYYKHQKNNRQNKLRHAHKSMLEPHIP